MAFSNKKKVILCIIGNYITAFFITVFVIVFRDPNSKYFRFGPHEDLIIISILVNSWLKWALAIVFIGIIKAAKFW